MLTSFGSGEIWKGSNQEISVVLVPRCYKVEGEITDVVINFYTTAGGTSIEFSGDTVTVSGINATVVFQPVQLDALDDGLIRYNVAFNEGGESHVFDLETRYMLKTPNDYEPVDYVTHADVEEVVDGVIDEKLEDYYTSGETNEAISNAMAAETARTENTYLKEHQSLADYWTSAQTESAITEATSGLSVPIATQNTLGVIKVGSGLTIDSAGTLANTDITYNLSEMTGEERAAAQAFMSANRTAYNYHIMYHINGDPGWIYSTQYSFDGNSGAIYLTFIGRENKKYLYLWVGSDVEKLSEETLLTTLPVASSNTLGGVKVGSGLTIDSGGTLASNLVPVYILKDQNEQYYIDIFNYVSNNSGNTGFVFYLENDHYGEPGWFESTIWQWGTQHTELWLTFYYGLVNPAHSVWILNSSGEFYTYAEGEMLTNLPVASSNTLGGIKVGSGLTIQEDGTLSAEGGGSVPVATTGSTGVVKVGSGLTIDSGGTLNNGVISVFIDEKQGSQEYYKAIYDFVRANSGDTSLVIYYANANLDRWYECLWYQCNENHFIFTFYDFDGSRIISNIIGNNGSYGNNRTDNLVMKPNSSEYSPFNKNLHLSSGGTLYFENTAVDSGGTYDNILNIWGTLILVGAYQFINTHTGPFDTMLCPLYVDSSSTDSGRTLMYPKVIDELTDGSIIHNGEVADHKITLVYDEYKVSYYCGGSHSWIVGLTVTPNSQGGGLSVYDYDSITGDASTRAELIAIVSGGTPAVVAKDGIMYYYRGYDEDKYIFVDYKSLTVDENAGNCRWGTYRSVKVDSNGAEFGGYGQDLGAGIQAWMYTTSEYQKHSVNKNGFLFASDNTYDIIPGSTPVIGETYTTIYFTIPGMLWWADVMSVTVNGVSHNISWWGGKAWNVDGDIYDENHTTEAGMTVDFSHVDNDGHGYISISAAAMTVTDIPNDGEGGGTSVSVPILATTNLQMYRNGEWNSISAIPNLVYSGASQGILASAVMKVKAGLYDGAYAGNDTFYILIDDLSQEAQSILYESVSGVSETVTLKAADYTAVIVKTISSGVYSLTITENPSVDLSDYWTSAQTQSAITDAISGIDLGDYYTSAQTDSAITTSIETAMTDVVISTTIDSIVMCTQSQYNAMSAHTNNILYFING